MVNPEHVEILAEGVPAWNKWRQENPVVIPDLSVAHLMVWDLERADLHRTNLTWAYASEARLSKADLSKADLARADLERADLSETNLSEANLSKADLSEANLSRANLVGANLFEANAPRADFTGANLGKTCLISCRLVGANLTGAELTGAKLYGTATDDWTIKDVKCRYVYWDISGIQRSPKDRDLEPGEFERLYATLPTIEYVFENGMAPLDPLIMDRVVQAIREKKPEFDIKIDSITARGLAPSIKFTVQQEEHKEPALQEVAKEYENRLKRLEAEKDRLYDLLGQAIDKAGMRLIAAGPGSIVATDGSTVNVEQHINNAIELQKAIAEEPEDSETFAKVAKKTALNILGDALKDFAKGQVKEAAKQIVELGKDLGPAIIKTAAYTFFQGCLG
jgi:hypothetical protein